MTNVIRQIEYYNLDMILSVGYRVKSQRGIEFRRWANQVLKEYLLRQEVPEKCIRISTATAEKLVAYKGKNQYTIGLVFAGDEPDPELIAEETEN